MRIVVSAMAALALAISAPGQAAEPQPAKAALAPAYRSALPKAMPAWIMLIRLRYDLYGRWKATGKWPDDPEANKALDAHSAYWADQLKQGRAILAGGMNGDYWDNVAVIIFEAPTQEEAEAIVAADPAVRAFVFQAQVRPFNLNFLTNKFGAGPAGEGR